jgi:hypothetical protein
MLPRAFVTGCDSNTEWMLPWFLKNYLKHNDTPIVFADFGVTEETRLYVQSSAFVDIVSIPKQQHNGWFLKPRTLKAVEADELCWLDTDIQILGDMSSVFKYVEKDKLSMAEDRPWTKRTGEHWHNSGVIAMKGKPQILTRWIENCSKNPSRGDQETLHNLLSFPPLLKTMHVNTLPNIYNWLRVQVQNDNEDSPHKLAMHWTGHKGKLQIKKLMYNEI